MDNEQEGSEKDKSLSVEHKGENTNILQVEYGNAWCDAHNAREGYPCLDDIHHNKALGMID